MSDRISIDAEAFAASGQTLQGKVSLQDLDARSHSPDIADLAAEVSYSLAAGRDDWDRIRLSLHLAGSLKLCCQRCLQPFDFELDETAQVVLFADEEALDQAVQDDDTLEGMVCGRELDVYSLLEDQILMALPFSPKHENCGSGETAVQSDKPNPFAALAGLKKPD